MYVCTKRKLKSAFYESSLRVSRACHFWLILFCKARRVFVKRKVNLHFLSENFDCFSMIEKVRIPRVIDYLQLFERFEKITCGRRLSEEYYSLLKRREFTIYTGKIRFADGRLKRKNVTRTKISYCGY